MAKSNFMPKGNKSMGGKSHKSSGPMGKKEAGFGAKLGKRRGSLKMDGPHK